MQDISRSPEQKFLGEKGFIAFITFLSAFIPLSTDIYLPALPSMVTGLHTTEQYVNLTLIFFFIFYAAGTLFWGPLSDKYGRRPVLMTGLTVYTLASFLCIFSGNVTELILARTLQAIGCGAATAVSTAIVKDAFEGRKRVTTLALVQSMGMISPIVSPVIGALILRTMSWRGIFMVLTAIGLVALAGSFVMTETIRQRNNGNIPDAFRRLGAVASIRPFRWLLLIFSMTSLATMSFISSSSYIFVEGFGVSETAYSGYFALNAVFFLLGPLVYIRLSRHVSGARIITLGYVVSAVSGLLIATVGHAGPMAFALSLIPASFTGSLRGPASTNLMLEQLDGDTGAASSLMSCAFTFFGSTGMMLISLGASNRLLMMGMMYLATGVAGLLLWQRLCHQPWVRTESLKVASHK